MDVFHPSYLLAVHHPSPLVELVLHMWCHDYQANSRYLMMFVHAVYNFHCDSEFAMMNV